MDTLGPLLAVQLTIVSLKFAQGFYKMLRDKGCVSEEDEGGIVMERFEKKLLKGEIDVEYLNQTLKADCEFQLDDEDIEFGDPINYS